MILSKKNLRKKKKKYIIYSKIKNILYILIKIIDLFINSNKKKNLILKKN
jgi:hypothetical protein